MLKDSLDAANMEPCVHDANDPNYGIDHEVLHAPFVQQYDSYEPEQTKMGADFWGYR